MARTETRDAAAGRAGLDTVIDAASRLATAHAALATEARAGDARVAKLRERVERARADAAKRLAERKAYWSAQGRELQRTLGEAHRLASAELDELNAKIARARDTLA